MSNIYFCILEENYFQLLILRRDRARLCRIVMSHIKSDLKLGDSVFVFAAVDGVMDGRFCHALAVPNNIDTPGLPCLLKVKSMIYKMERFKNRDFLAEADKEYVKKRM